MHANTVKTNTHMIQVCSIERHVRFVGMLSSTQFWKTWNHLRYTQSLQTHTGSSLLQSTSMKA